MRLLRLVALNFNNTFDFDVMEGLWHLPLYTPQLEAQGIPEPVLDLRNRVARADAVIISTPEYLHNIPAVLKNALEWMTTSGELAEKPVLALTLTPRAPRGEHAMRSLTASLVASKARVVAELPLYRNEMMDDQGELFLDEERGSLLAEAIRLLCT